LNIQWICGALGELTADDRHAGTLLARRLAEIADGKGIETLNIFLKLLTPR
jgi:hypothetical protein